MHYIEYDFIYTYNWIIYQKPNKLVGRVNGAVTKIQYVLFTSLLTKDVILEEEWGSEVL